MSEDTNLPEMPPIESAAQYQEQALLTVAPDDAIDFKRVHYGTTRRALREFITAGTLLDHVKKSAVYGRPFPAQLSAGEVPCPKPDLSKIDIQVVHALLGIITEAAELAQALEAVLFRGADVDLVNLLEESGDIDWYQALLDSRIEGASQEARWTTNIEKLVRKRYVKSGGFTAEEANVRDTEGEREVLEAGHGTAVEEKPEGAGSEEPAEEPVASPDGSDADSSTEAEGDNEPVVINDDTTEFNEDPAPDAEGEGFEEVDERDEDIEKA